MATEWQLRCGLWYYWSWRQIHQLRNIFQNILHEEISKYKHFLSPRADWLFRDSTSGATILTHYQANVFLPTFSQKYLSYMPMDAKLGSAHAPVIFLPRSEIIHLRAQLFLSLNYINTFIWYLVQFGAIVQMYMPVFWVFHQNNYSSKIFPLGRFVLSFSFSVFYLIGTYLFHASPKSFLNNNNNWTNLEYSLPFLFIF